MCYLCFFIELNSHNSVIDQRQFIWRYVVSIHFLTLLQVLFSSGDPCNFRISVLCPQIKILCNFISNQVVSLSVCPLVSILSLMFDLYKVQCLNLVSPSLKAKTWVWHQPCPDSETPDESAGGVTLNTSGTMFHENSCLVLSLVEEM